MNKNAAILQIKVTPRSAKRLITEITGDGLVRIRLTSPPVEGKANQELIRFLADELGIGVSEVEIRTGESSRKKLVKIHGLDLPEVLEKLREKTKSASVNNSAAGSTGEDGGR